MFSNLDEFIRLGYISKRRHPSKDLFILNYTPKTQYERFWNETTLSCRGLIVDSKNNIKARCFKKFFNYEEVISEVDKRISNSIPFVAHEKIDGSLGILYWLDGSPFIATRGSFESEQAKRANQILYSRPRNGLNKDLTYLLEIVYPENRICVDYGNMEELILLSAIDTNSGEEVFDCSSPFTKAKECRLNFDFNSAKSQNIPNKEGFVIRFDDGYRFKIKFEDYVRLHTLIFSVSSKSIWRSLMNGHEIPIASLPDEIYGWVDREKRLIEHEYSKIINEAKSLFSEIKNLPRKEFAKIAIDYKYSSVLFSMLDKKPHEQTVWKLVEPENRTPFD